MRRRLFSLPASLCLLLLAAACVKTAEEENKTEIIGGDAQHVQILAGVTASPSPLAKSYCAQYQKFAYLRDAVPEGTARWRVAVTPLVSFLPGLKVEPRPVEG